MNYNLIKIYSEFLINKGYSPQTINAYAKALMQATNTWNTTIPIELYENITYTLKFNKDIFFYYC